MGRYNLREVRGVGITQVSKDSPAEKAGLRKDDVILRFEGENVTANVRTIGSIPERVKAKDFPAIFEVRGEIFMNAADFLAMNARQQAEGAKIFNVAQRTFDDVDLSDPIIAVT